MKFRAIVVPFYERKTIGWYFRQICSEFACFLHRFTGNSGVSQIELWESTRKNVSILQSRYSFRYQKFPWWELRLHSYSILLASFTGF
jgi:hypothetical protein